MAAKVADFEYATQLFGFTPKAFVDGIYNAVNDYIKEFFKEMGNVLEEEFAKGDAILSSKIREGCKELIAKCYQSVDDRIDKMEIYMLKNVFTIPTGVLLPEDEVHNTMVSTGETVTEPSLDKDILELKTEILKEIRYRELIQCEQERLRKILGELKRCDNECFHTASACILLIMFIYHIYTAFYLHPSPPPPPLAANLAATDLMNVEWMLLA